MKKDIFFTRQGYGVLIIAAALFIALWFVISYGERLNPWDGKTWNDFDKKTPQFDWSLRSIQIERQWNDGQWHPMDAIKLETGMIIQGDAVENPNFKIEPSPVVADDKVTLEWHVNATCRGKQTVDIVLDTTTAMKPWSETFACGDKSWRLSLVPTSEARFPPVAGPEDMLPGAPNQEK